MAVLYIDTSDSTSTTVALKSGKKTIEMIEKTGKQKSQNVLPLVDKLIKKKSISLNQISEIEVNCGPGSFTGTRVGVSVSNTIAWILGIPVNGQKPPVVPTYSKSKFDY